MSQDILYTAYIYDLYPLPRTGSHATELRTEREDVNWVTQDRRKHLAHAFLNTESVE
jgi:hypothetical protein